MSLLVAMIKQTFVDLVPFLTFFFIMVIVFTFIMGVLGFQNYKGNNNGHEDPSQEEDGANEAPGVEYHEMGRWPANFLAVFRMALGDNDMGALYYMEPGNQIMFWFIWFLISLLF